MQRWLQNRANGESSLGPALLLVLIVALPSAAMLWLMNEATQNERLAVRQRLMDVYGGQLELVRKQVAVDWQHSLATLNATASGHTPARTFARCVNLGLADSVIVLDSQGQPSYPTPQNSTATDAGQDNADWQAARRLEFVDHNPHDAVIAYDRIARTTRDDNLAAQAVQAQVRLLLVAGKKEAAVKFLREQIKAPRLQSARGPGGRWLLADLMLVLVEITRESDPQGAAQTAAALAMQMRNYDRDWLDSAQRRFVSHTLDRLVPGLQLPMLAAEDLAAEYVERGTDQTASRHLQPTGIPDVWKVLSPDSRVLALFRITTLRSYLERRLDNQAPLAGARLALLDPQDSGGGDEFVVIPLGTELPQWRISLSLVDDPFAATASQRSRFYFWTALLTIVATGSLALLVAFTLRRQMRLSRLKTDLVATVSHELKTPVSSIRLLVDTLLDQESLNLPQTREYLQLISRENARLCRLIENFLTFSRLERGKQQFATGPLDPADVARQASQVLHERLHEPNCLFEVDIQADLSPVTGDTDALVTVLVNLLDNALKFSSAPKRIKLRVFARAGQVCFAVEDNGIGLSARHRQRVFDRFYQVDQQLTRPAGGCGLGLSIVRSIVAAHGGTVEVESEPDTGSTFLIVLPATKSTTALKDSCTTS